jgi:hypothetical protein
MMLLTKEIKQKLPKLGSTQSKDPKDIPIIVKFFSPWTGWTWYATEGQEVEGIGWLFFGFVRGCDDELGEFSLKELEEAKRGDLPLVERDKFFGYNHTLAEAQAHRI